jgi:ATP-dependent Clp protease adaptor protein ClpS
MPPIHDSDTSIDQGTRLDSELRIDEPKMFRVLLHNDHYTTMEFVIDVLISVFHMPAAQATKVMLDVHNRGQGVCGVYTFDVAITKVKQVHEMARAREFPLKCSYEEA